MRQQAKPDDKPSIDHALVMVHDQPQPCPYLTDRQARMPLHWPNRPIDADLMDDFLAAGYRRSGSFLYRTQCPGCQSCEPSRIDVEQFRWSRSFRRVLRRGDECIEVRFGPPEVDQPRIDLLNKHRMGRDLSISGDQLDEADYRSFLIDSCCDTQEMSYFIDQQLVAVATVDVGNTSLSAVYCYFDTDHERLSLGTYSILKQIEFALDTSRRYLYLGMYVAENSHLNYKARFLPQQRMLADKWISFDDNGS
jgi:leucyl-tRNA---protein transferase